MASQFEELRQTIESKIDRKEFNELKNKIVKDLTNKISLEDVEKIVKNFQNEVFGNFFPNLRQDEPGSKKPRGFLS